MKFITKFTKNFFSYPVAQPASPAGRALACRKHAEAWSTFFVAQALACKKHAEAWSTKCAGAVIRKKLFQRKKAYTLIEILIVIAIIAILATIILISFINAQAKSRDSERRSEVQSIANALKAYNMETKSWLVQGPPPDNAGTGYISLWGSTGTGWFNLTGDGSGPTKYSLKSIATALVERKFLIETLRDPKMTYDWDQSGNNPGENYQYMVYECPYGDYATPYNRTGLAVYAKLEHPNQEDLNAVTAEASRPDDIDKAKCNTKWPFGHNLMNFIIIVK